MQLPVDGAPFLVIERQLALHDEAVDLGIRVSAEVVLPRTDLGGMEQRGDVRGVIEDPRGQDDVEVVLGEDGVLPGLPFLELDLHAHADGLEVILEREHHPLDRLALLLDRHLERERQGLAALLHDAVGTRGEAGLVQERDRLRGVVRQRLHVEVVGPAAGGEGARDDRALAVEEGVEHLLAVHRVREGAAHPLVGEQRASQVVAEERIRERVVRLQDEAPVALQLRQITRVDEHEHVDGVEHHRLRHDVLVRKRLGEELVDVRSALEIILVGHQHDLAVGADALDDVGTGPDGVPHEGILAGEVLGVRRSVRGDHLEAELRERVEDRPLEGEAHRGVVQLLDLLDELVAHLERRDRLRVHHDVVREEHVVGREEPRCLAIARMPAHALAQEEGVGAPVLRHLPALGQLGDDRLLLVDPDQPVEHQLRDAQRDHLVARDRIEGGRPAVLAVGQDAAVRPAVVLRRRRGGGRYRRQHGQGQDERHDPG